MNRRTFLQYSTMASALTLAGALLPEGAYAVECPMTGHLLGEIPDGANAVISSTGRFHHFHYLHIPASVLAAPPAAGWTTITSMMVQELGIDDYFYLRTNVRRQFHCHKVSFTNAQLQAIAAGKQTEVVAYIEGDSGPQKNHTFLFNEKGTNPATAFADRFRDIQALARRRGLRNKRSSCDTRTHGGVTVFSGDSTDVVTDLAELNRLKNY